MSFSRLFRCWLRGLSFFGTFIPDKENAGGSAIGIHKELLPEDAIVTHMIACQGRDHVQAFTPKNSVSSLHIGLRIPTLWICEPEEGWFNVWNQTFTDGDAEGLQCFIPFFHMFLRLLNLITLGGTPQPLGPYALCQGLIASLTYPWLRRAILTATRMSSRTWGTGTFRVITRRYVLSW